ncbi:SWI/SNF- matrix-associated actin-dependent regulator of chromatin subfamily A-like protein 1 [Gurleya vavrai]
MNNKNTPTWKKIINNLNKSIEKTQEPMQKYLNKPNIQSVHVKPKETEINKPNIQTANIKEKEVIIKKNIELTINSLSLIVVKPTSGDLSKLLSKHPSESVFYNIEKKEWTIKLNYFEKIKSELKKYFLFKEIPKGVLQALINEENKKTVNFDLSEDVYKKLLPFQLEGVNQGLNKGGRLLLADEMGLGKTYQALAIVYYYKVEWPLLIVSPASLLENWKISVMNFLNMESFVIRKKEHLGNKISIISYDIASRFFTELSQMNYKVIILDECHYIKNHAAKRTTNLMTILQKSSRLILLSGTPALSRPIELYTSLIAINKNYFSSMTEYGYRYCDLRKNGQYFDWKGCSNHSELYFFLKKCVMIRRTKDEVLSQLPAKFRRQVVLEVEKSKKIKKEEDAVKKLLKSNLGEKVCIEDKEISFEYTTIEDSYDESLTIRYQIAAELKIEAVKEYLRNMLERNIKFLVFAHHAIMINALEEFLKENTRFVKIDGKTASANRQRLVDEFQNEDKCRVALLGLTACSTGLTLTAAKAVIFAELYWNPGTLLQAEDRVHRIGQKNTVDIHYLTALGTVDTYVWPNLLRKLNTLEKLGIGHNNLKGMQNVDAKQKSIQQFTNKK